jgi:hypothetical protein
MCPFEAGNLSQRAYQCSFFAFITFGSGEQNGQGGVSGMVRSLDSREHNIHDYYCCRCHLHQRILAYIIQIAMIATTTIKIPVPVSSGIIIQVPFVSEEISHADIDEKNGKKILLNNVIHHHGWNRHMLVQPGSPFFP